MSLWRLAGHTCLALLLSVFVHAHEGHAGAEQDTLGKSSQHQPGQPTRLTAAPPGSLQHPWVLLQRGLLSERPGGTSSAGAALEPASGGASAAEPAGSREVLVTVNELLAARGLSALDPAESLRAANITSLINSSVLPSVLKTHAEDQGEINASRDAVSNVEDMAVVSFKYVENLETVVDDYRREHRGCRAAKLESCSRVNSTCSAPDIPSWEGCSGTPDAKNRSALLEHAERMLRYWTKVNDTLAGGQARCNEATENCSAYAAACARVQQSFELGFCTWREKLQTVCDWYSTSLETVVAAYHQRVKAVREAESARQQEYRALMTLLCYLDVWWGDKGSSGINCAGLPVDLAPVTIRYPDLPASPGTPICGKLNLTEYPCNPGFIQQEYSGIAGMLPYDVAECSSCPSSGTPQPTPSPTRSPTPRPPEPTAAPSTAPTPSPTSVPTPEPAPTPEPTPIPSPPPTTTAEQTTTAPTSTVAPPSTSGSQAPTPAPPAEVTAWEDPAFWFSAADLSVADGSSVDVLPDRSGHGNNATALPDGRARFVASAVAGRPAVHFPATPPWRCYDTPPLPSGDRGQVTIAAVLQWESQHDWATVAEFQHDEQYAVKRHGGKDLCGLQTKGLCAGYFMGEKEEALLVPYIYTARYDGSEWRACLLRIDNASAEEACSQALGPGGINASGVLRLGGSEPGSGFCNHEAMSGWLSEFVIWHRAKTDEELQAIKATFLRRRMLGRPTTPAPSAPVPAPGSSPTPTPGPQPNPYLEPRPAPTAPQPEPAPGLASHEGDTSASSISLPAPTTRARRFDDAGAFDGAEFWFDAAQLSAQDGQEVGVLPDRSGNANNATQVEDFSAARFAASAVSGRPALHFPVEPPWKCYDTPRLPGGNRGQITIAAVLQWEGRHDWGTVAEFRHDRQYALKRHGGKELCGLQTRGLCASYFMGENSEDLATPYVYTAVYNGTEWRACLQEIGGSREEVCVGGRGPAAIEGSGVLRLGGSSPGSGYCTDEAMGGWLSEFIVWPLAKAEDEMQVIKAVLLGK